MIPRVKICGLRRPQDIEAVNEFKADYAGFVFFEKSRRNISYEKAAELIKMLDGGIKKAAVCVSPSKDELKSMAALGFDIIQIHGRFPEDDVLKKIDLPMIWQAVNIKDGIRSGLFSKSRYISGYVVDGAGYGSGKTFGWEKAKADPAGCGEAKPPDIRHIIPEGKEFILAGGLNAQNVKTGIEIFLPDIVDVSSGVEKDGFKDRELIGEFIRKVRKA